MPTRAKATKPASELPVKSFATQKAWHTWLDAHHPASSGVWLRFARLSEGAKGTKSITHPEALDVALCYGWIDGQTKRVDTTSWMQKFTPRGSRSIWSKINCEKAAALIASGAMRPAGLAAIALARKDGRWDAAYAGQRTAVVPDDLRAALDRSPEASAFFATLGSKNRYAILFRIHTAKKTETRAKRIEQFVRMLEKHETLHPVSNRASTGTTK